MAHRTVIAAVDLGTTSTTASFGMVADSRDPNGKHIRKKYDNINVTDVKDWPGGNKNDATGNICVPTDLIYERASRQLIYWGFEAQQYLDETVPDIAPEHVYHVQHIKLLIPGPDEARVPTPATARYRALREELIQVLGKRPDEVFEDFLNAVIEHIVHSAKRKYYRTLGQASDDKIELVLAFPSGWPDYVHTRVAEIGSRAMQKAIQMHELQKIQFGIEDVYTVSETLCGVKEWFRDTIAETAVSYDMDQQGTNLDELNEGDCFLPCDIGGGTGCLTPLRLVSKYPLRVDQLGPTQSLEVSGEAVEAAFERWIRQHLTKKQYKGDLERQITRICRKFKEDKKDCGLSGRAGTRPWSIAVPGLRANASKGFEKDCMRLARTYLERAFDGPLDILEAEITKAIEKFPGIKAIVFLGQFGGSSEYLRKRMAGSPISQRIKICHSESGKLNVVKGAISERMQINDSFVRKFKTVKSYGTLVALDWHKNSEGQQLFPNAVKDGAVPIERQDGLLSLKVIEWAIPKGTILENGIDESAGNDSTRRHTWPANERNIGFEDILVVSDEIPPAPDKDGKSFTLWTKAHENNLLEVNGEMRVQKIIFGWDIDMARKVDADGNDIGPYDTEDLEEFWIHPKGKRRSRRRALEYEQILKITEMQVKLYIQPLFPCARGKPTTYLAHQLSLTPNDRMAEGESRSKALEQDIEIVAAALLPTPTPEPETSSGGSSKHPGDLTDINGHVGVELVNELGRESHQQPPELHQNLPAGRAPSLCGYQNVTSGLAAGSSSNLSCNRMPAPPRSPVPNMFRQDGRRRDGCYTCKSRKKRCDCIYTLNEHNNRHSCNECVRHQLTCHQEKPESEMDPEEREAQKLERTRLIKLGKRKAREESDSSDSFSRDRSATLRPEFHLFSAAVRPSIEARENSFSGQPSTNTPQKRGAFTATRGGKDGSKNRGFYRPSENRY